VRFLGALAAYTSVIQEYVSTLVLLYYKTESDIPKSIIPICMALLMAFFIYPLSLSKNMAKLAFTSFLSLVCIVYVVLLVPWSYTQDFYQKDYVEPETHIFEFTAGFLFTWSNVGMAFVNHSNVIEICAEMSDPNDIRKAVNRGAPSLRSPTRTAKGKKINRSHLPSNHTSPTGEEAGLIPRGILTSDQSQHSTCSCVQLIRASQSTSIIDPTAVIVLTGIFISGVYLLVGLCGYFHYGSTVNPNILSSEPLTTPFILARGGILICMVFSFPLLVYPSRICLEQMVRRATHSTPITNPDGEALGQLSDSAAPTVKQETWVPLKVIVIMFLALIISHSFSALDKILAFTGSLAGSFVVYIFPGASLLFFPP
jgi:amino acid permease